MAHILLAPREMRATAEKIAESCKKKDVAFSLDWIDIVRFANGELKPRVPESVRRKRVFLLAGFHGLDPNTAVMELLLSIDALVRTGVEDVTLVTPYLPYLRQDKEGELGTPLSARLLAELLCLNSHVKRIITVEMHADRSAEFFRIPVSNLNADVVQSAFLRKRFANGMHQVAVVAPDFGSVSRAQRFAAELGSVIPVSFIEKRRPAVNQAVVVAFSGADMARRDVIIYDDMIDTGGTIRAAAEEILRRGARSVCTCVTHGIFSAQAETYFAATGHTVVATTTIPRPDTYYATHASWLHTLPIEDLVATAINTAACDGG